MWQLGLTLDDQNEADIKWATVKLLVSLFKNRNCNTVTQIAI